MRSSRHTLFNYTRDKFTGRVLYIDDDPRVRGVVSVLLQQLGQNVDVAANAAEGLALFRANQYDAVLTDLAMPEINGWEVTRIVKATRPGVPVIIVTGWAEDVVPQADPEAYPDLILRKPVSLQTLREALAEVAG